MQQSSSRCECPDPDAQCRVEWDAGEFSQVGIVPQKKGKSCKHTHVQSTLYTRMKKTEDEKDWFIWSRYVDDWKQTKDAGYLINLI